eukprot:NODE_484_length_6933_cov_0.508341.p7 type:complete len:105 gc:universal NODE_484_length_6933_cov_0.508341:6408-6722(+)
MRKSSSSDINLSKTWLSISLNKLYDKSQYFKWISSDKIPRFLSLLSYTSKYSKERGKLSIFSNKFCLNPKLLNLKNLSSCNSFIFLRRLCVKSSSISSRSIFSK